MASTGPSIFTASKPPLVPLTFAASAASSFSSASTSHGCRCYLGFDAGFGSGRSFVAVSKSYNRGRRQQQLVVCMAPEEEKLTRRSPLDFPIEWERPKPGRRPDIFPQFSPIKAPIPPPLPYDPPEEDEEEEEEEKKEEEEEEDPEKEEEPGKIERQ